MKICQVVFSTNRIPYLTRTLESQSKFLDFTGHSVTKMFFDDFPKGRDDTEITALAKSHGYDEIYLHTENKSIGATWRECWDLIRDRDYDYVFHSEDDVTILEPVIVADLIDFLESVPKASQCVLKRQNWYPHEKPSEPLPDDLIHGQFRGEFSVPRSYFFTPICSLYSMKHVRFDYVNWYREKYPNEPIFQGANPNEAIIGKSLLEGFGLQSLHVKNAAGGNLIEHIGEYTIGKRLLSHEPGYATFAHLDPDTKYDSKSGKPFNSTLH
jgi:hypothetical protein